MFDIKLAMEWFWKKAAEVATPTPPPPPPSSPKSWKIIFSVVLVLGTVGWILFLKYYSKKDKRTLILEELLTTERTYVTNIQTLFRDYMIPIRDEKLLDENTYRRIFPSTLEVIKKTNETLLERMEQRLKRVNTSSYVADIFLEMMPFFKSYSGFINNFDHAAAALRVSKKNKSFQTWLQNKAKTSEPLDSLLITPVQRIPRYILLFTDLLKNTDNKHRDYENISAALEQIKKTAGYLDHNKQVADNLEKVVQLEKKLKIPHDITRSLVREGTLEATHSSKTRNPYWFLFSDCLIGTKIKKSTISKKVSYQVIETVFRGEVSRVSTSGTSVILEIPPNRSFSLIPPPDDYISWVDSLEKSLVADRNSIN